MLNGQFAHEQARLSGRAGPHAEAGDDPQRPSRPGHRNHPRPRSDRAKKSRDGLELLKQLTEEHDRDPQDALRYWCLVALNQNEFLYLD